MRMMSKVGGGGRTVGLVALAMGLALSGAVWGAGEKALLPMPREVSAKDQRRAQVFLQAMGMPESEHRLVGKVAWVSEGVRTEGYVVAPEGDVAVGEAKELGIVEAPGMPVTFVATSQVMVGFAQPTGEREAARYFGEMGLKGNVRRIEGLSSVYVVETASALESFEKSLEMVAKGGVRYAQPDGKAMLSTFGGGGNPVVAPDPHVVGPMGEDIPDNTGTYSFGVAAQGTPISKTFKIKNLGTDPLTITLPLTAPAGFAVLQQPATSVAPTAETTFVVALSATQAGTFQGTVAFANNSSTENPYNFTVTGTVSGSGGGGSGVSDPLFPIQWHLRNDGSGTGGAQGFDLNILDAWSTTLGAGAIVAVTDDGSQPDHPDYVDNVMSEITNYWVRADAADAGDGSHGTASAGLVAGKANEIGGRGSAPSAKLILINSFRDLAGNPRLFSAVATDWAAASTAGAMVNTNSWGPSPLTVFPISSLTDALEDLTVNARSGKGTLFMVAAGNSAGPLYPTLPAGYANRLSASPNAFTVGAFTNQGTRSGYSSTGGTWLDAVAPSSGSSSLQPGTLRIVTTDVTDAEGYRNADSPEGDYTENVLPSGFGGTSAATPMAAGVAALVFSNNTDLTARQVARILRHTARRDLVVGQGNPFRRPAQLSDSFGYGRIDASAAVEAAADAQQLGGLTWPAEPTNVTLARSANSATVFWNNPPTGTAGEFSRALVVRYSGGVGWTPTDGLDYSPLIGSDVALGVRILAVTPDTTATDPQVTLVSNVTYVVYAMNAANRYSFGVAAPAFPFEGIEVFADGMEDDVVGWIAESGAWERGTPAYTVPPFISITQAHTGTGVRGTDLDDIYLGTAGGMDGGGGGGGGTTPFQHVMLSPEIDLTAENPLFAGRVPTSVSVRFFEILDSVGEGYDTVTLDVVDSKTFARLKTLITKNDGSSFAWRERWFDIRSTAGRKVRLRWTLATSLQFGLGGWYIDDLRVGASTRGEGPIGSGPRRVIIPLPGIGGIGELAGAGGFVFSAPLSDNPDLNGDGRVDVGDLAVLLRSFGSTIGEDSYNDLADLDQDGKVGMIDLVGLLSSVPSK